MTIATDALSAQSGRRVHWMELFFDLIFVALIAQLAHGLHDHPGVNEFAAFVLLFFPAWWAWMNVMLTVNVFPTLSVRALGVSLLLAMMAVGLMAAAAPEGLTEKAWAFAAGNAGLRLILLTLWIRRARLAGSPVGRPLLYNGVTAVIWLASVAVPHPYNFWMWALAILIEVSLITAGPRGYVSRILAALDPSHLGERLGLFMIIVMGESVLSLVTSLGENWTFNGGTAAFLGFAVIGLLAWAFFIYGTDAMEEGIHRLIAINNFRGLRDTVMYLPFLLVVGVTAVAAALAAAVHHPEEPLPLGSAVALGGGIALFYLTNTIVSIRYGVPFRQLLPWASVAVPASFALIPLAAFLPALGSLGAAAGLIALLVLYAEKSRKHRLKAEGDAAAE